MNQGMNAKTAQRDDWRTPRWLFERLHALYQFTIDAAADAENAKLPRFWTAEQDALKQSWRGERVFCNPPFSLKGEFAATAACREAEVAVLILPATVEQPWFHRHVIGARAELIVPLGRVEFDPPPGVEATSPRFASLVAVYKIDSEVCIVRSLGRVKETP